MNKNNLKIGDILYHSSAGPVKITKLGNKYLSVEALDSKQHCYLFKEKFYIENFYLVSDYTSAKCLYFNEQEFLDEKERNQLFKKIKNDFNYYTSNEKFTLDQLRRINLILEEKL